MFTSKSDKTLRKAAATILGLPEDASVGYILWDMAHRVKEMERKQETAKAVVSFQDITASLKDLSARWDALKLKQSATGENPCSPTES
jgi:hypothetical protein